MTQAEEVDWASVRAELAEDDGEAVRGHLDVGRAIAYRDVSTPLGQSDAP